MYGGNISAYLHDLRYISRVSTEARDLYTKAAIILARRSGKTLV